MTRQPNRLLAAAVAVVIGLWGLVFLSLNASAADIPPDLIRRVELEWEEQDKAQAYELELGTSPDFSQNLYSERIEKTKFSVDLLPGAYYYRVRAIDDQGRPGRWTPVQDLSINARPPFLISPKEGELVQGNLPDTGLPLIWRMSGPGIKYLIEIKAQNPQTGEFNEVVVREEVSGTEFPFFPANPGKYQWSVHTLGAGGDESGKAQVFGVEGVFPYNAGPDAARFVRYVPPWWRGHWTAYAHYGQDFLVYTILDQDFRASGGFPGFTGYTAFNLNWEWHDPVSWLHHGIPWVEGELEFDRQTVLNETVLLPRYSLRLGTAYDNWRKGWRFSDSLAFATREFAIYQPISTTQAIRANTTRFRVGMAPSVEWSIFPFLTIGVTGQIFYEFGGQSGTYPKNGKYDAAFRAGSMNGNPAVEGEGSLILSFGKRLRLKGRARFEYSEQTWKAYFPPYATSKVTFMNTSFDVSAGFKF